jgi:acetylglutamate kinase
VAKLFAADAVLLKLLGLHPVVVHGGGPQISRMLDKAGVKSTFVDGLRVTDEATMEVAEMVLSGAINKEIANWITLAGREADVRGVGLSGKDARLIIVEKTRTKRDPDSNIEHVVDLGFVGEPTQIDPPKLIESLIFDEKTDYVPVIAPIGVSRTARPTTSTPTPWPAPWPGALKAKRMLLLTDVAGVLDAGRQLIRQMTVSEARALIETGVAIGGMIPKLETAMAAVGRRRGRGHPRRAPSARHAGRAVHRTRGGHPDLRRLMARIAPPRPHRRPCATSTTGCSTSTTPSIRPKPS